eukprot:snap_masked-scaffold_5-processed-gene-13.55-mRNA-1 protein AED:1.00 eAED:1.00 QI:0/-1/0/0/-1/1/1/0/153
MGRENIVPLKSNYTYPVSENLEGNTKLLQDFTVETSESQYAKNNEVTNVNFWEPPDEAHLQQGDPFSHVASYSPETLGSFRLSRSSSGFSREKERLLFEAFSSSKQRLADLGRKVEALLFEMYALKAEVNEYKVKRKSFAEEYSPCKKIKSLN